VLSYAYRRAAVLPFLALAALAACAPGGSTRESQGSVDRVFTPQQYTVEDFYRNTRFFGGSWAPDRQKLLVSSNLSGIWNAYSVPVGGGDPQPLTQSTGNSIFAQSYFPGDERIIYTSDQGGNELTHVYVRDPDGTTKDLTPGAKLKASFQGWAGDDKSFFISTNERDARFFDLYEIAIDGYARTLLYKNTEGFEIGPVSRDKRHIALMRPRTTSDADIFVHDRTTNTTKNITEHTGTVNNSPSDFSPDGTQLVFDGAVKQGAGSAIVIATMALDGSGFEVVAGPFTVDPTTTNGLNYSETNPMWI